MKSVLIYEPQDFSNIAFEMLRKKGYTVSYNYSRISIIAALSQYEIIYIRLGVNISLDILQKVKKIKCKYLIIPATGTDHIDEDNCNKYNIEIISFKNKKYLLKTITATAELTLALTFILLRNLIPAIESVRQGVWNRDLFRGLDINSRVVGIIGYGRLGKIIANYFYFLGAKVYIYEKKSTKLPSHLFKATSINQIFEISEIITLHVNYEKANENLINSSHFSLSTKCPIFINTSRGQLVNEDDLINALKLKYISGAAIDVVCNEIDFNINNPLLKYAHSNKNLILTPHIGGCTIDSTHKTEEIITEYFIQSY